VKRRQAKRAKLLADRADASKSNSAAETTTTTQSNDHSSSKKKSSTTATASSTSNQSREASAVNLPAVSSNKKGADDDSDAEIDTIEMPTEKQLSNIYNRGIFKNFHEVLFPPSLYSTTKKTN
jgi:hypothetical protein